MIFEEDSHQRDCASLIIDKLRTKFVLSLPNYTFLLWVEQEQMSSPNLARQLPSTKVIHPRGRHAFLWSNILRRTARHTPKRPKQTIHTTTKHSLRAKMPKKAHKPPNVPCMQKTLIFPSSKSSQQQEVQESPTQHTYFTGNAPKIFSGHCGPENPAFHKQLWAGVFCASAEDKMWWSCMETARQDCKLFIVLSRHPPTPWKSKLALARTFMGPHSPSALHSEKASTCSPQRPRRQHQPNSKGLCHNAYSAAHGQSTANLHVSAVRTNSFAPKYIWIHGLIYWIILENKKDQFLE